MPDAKVVTINGEQFLVYDSENTGQQLDAGIRKLAGLDADIQAASEAASAAEAAKQAAASSATAAENSKNAAASSASAAAASQSDAAKSKQAASESASSAADSAAEARQYANQAAGDRELSFWVDETDGGLNCTIQDKTEASAMAEQEGD